MISSYLFFFTCIRGTGRDLMGRFFCPIGVQRCIASRFSTTSQARLISYQFLLLMNYFPPSQAGKRPDSPSISISNTTTLIMFQALKRERGQVHEGERLVDAWVPFPAREFVEPGKHQQVPLPWRDHHKLVTSCMRNLLRKKECVHTHAFYE